MSKKNSSRFVLLVAMLIICNSDASINSATIIVDGSLSSLPPNFLSFGWEMFAFISAEHEGILQDKIFQNLVKALAPAVLRVGGITADWVYYDIDSKGSGEIAYDGLWPDKEQNLTMETFEELVNFTVATGMNLVFDLNELHGRDCHVDGACTPKCTCVGDWDTSNLLQFLKYVQASPHLDQNIYAWELGNEMTQSHHITMVENIADMKILSALVSEIWDNQTKWVVGPSEDDCLDGAAPYMNGIGSKLYAYSYHSYPAGGCIDYAEKMLNRSWLATEIVQDDHHAHSAICIEEWRKHGKPFKLWLTESNACWNMWDVTSTPAWNFQNGFWYVASLGQYAEVGVTVHSRWDIQENGGFSLIYNLPDSNIRKWKVASDYWIALVHKKTVGTRVLRLNITSSTVLMYGYCSPSSQLAGALTLMYANPSTSSCAIQLFELQKSSRLEYIFTVPDPSFLNSTVTLLNGIRLELTDEQALPPIKPHKILPDSKWIVPPLSYGFVILPEAGVNECMHT